MLVQALLMLSFVQLNVDQHRESLRHARQAAASGMTNRDVAAALFISPKTVEHNLARVYRKLGIHSRAELGQRIRQPTVRETPDSPGAANH